MHPGAVTGSGIVVVDLEIQHQAATGVSAEIKAGVFPDAIIFQHPHQFRDIGVRSWIEQHHPLPIPAGCLCARFVPEIQIDVFGSGRQVDGLISRVIRCSSWCSFTQQIHFPTRYQLDQLHTRKKTLLHGSKSAVGFDRMCKHCAPCSRPYRFRSRHWLQLHRM